MLTVAAADPSSYGEGVIDKMRWNLWLALNDAKLLLEPSELNIQALLYVLSTVRCVSSLMFIAF